MPILPHKIPPRLIIYAKDIQNITGKKERTARRMLAQIKAHYGKQPTELVTIDEFCAYAGLKENVVRPYLV